MRRKVSDFFRPSQTKAIGNSKQADIVVGTYKTCVFEVAAKIVVFAITELVIHRTKSHQIATKKEHLSFEKLIFRILFVLLPDYLGFDVLCATRQVRCRADDEMQSYALWMRCLMEEAFVEL